MSSLSRAHGRLLHLRVARHGTAGKVRFLMSLLAMTILVEPQAPAANPGWPDLAPWSAAEFLDAPFSDEVTLRALVCRAGAGKWQWSIISLRNGGGEMICCGVEKSTGAARTAVAAEMAKCLENAIGEAAAETV